MKNYLIVLCTALCLGFFFSCDDRDDKLTGPNIRIQNLSTRNFETVAVRVDSILFENVAAEGFSDYKELDLLYRQDTIKVAVDSLDLSFVPQALGDPLPIGLYTYQLNINEAGELELNFQLD